MSLKLLSDQHYLGLSLYSGTTIKLMCHLWCFSEEKQWINCPGTQTNLESAGDQTNTIFMVQI